MLADVAERYLRRGSKVYVEGQLQTRKWTDKNGAERYVTEIVIGPGRGELTLLSDPASDTPSQPNDWQAPLRSSASQRRPQQDDDLNDEVPF